MATLHHGFQIPDHDAIYSRMNLISTVPLSVDPQDKSSTSLQKPDQLMESVSNVLSKHTKNIDSWLSTQDKYKSKRKKQEVLLPFDRGPPAGYQDDLFISLSPAIETPENIIKQDEDIHLNPDNEKNHNILADAIHSTEALNEQEIVTRDIDLKLPINEEIEQNVENESEIEIEINIHDESKNYSEYYNEEEEEEANEEIEKPKTQRNLKEAAKSSRVNTEEIEATHRFKSLLKTRNMSPEPCTYDPNFSAVLPTINVPQLPPREKNDPYSPPKTPKQIELMSSTEVLGMYNSNLREFNPTNVHIRNFENLYIHYPNETKNVYDYIFKPKPQVDTNQVSPRLSESESLSSMNENTTPKTNLASKSKSKLSTYSLSTSRKQKSENNPKKSKNPKSYKRSNLINIEKNDNFILRPTSTLDSKVPRDEVFRNYSGAKHLGPGQYNLPQQKPPVVLDMSNLHDRDCLPTKKGSQRIYPLAVEQADKLRPNKPFHKFSTDTSRESKVVKNRRIQMLDKFKKEKQDLINEICKKSSLMSAKISSISSKNSSENDFNEDYEGKKRKISISELAEDELNYSIDKRSKSALKKRTPFDIQSSRPSLLPGEKNYANDPEPVYQFDPIESFKKMQPEVKFTTIRSRPKPLSDEKFWKTTWYGT